MNPLTGQPVMPGGVSTRLAALHRAIVCTDVEGFGDLRRTDLDQLTIRDGLYRALCDAFTRSGVLWRDCYHEDRGDGVLILVRPEVPKEILVTDIPRELAAALGEHNQTHRVQARIRLRLAVHAGEVCFDEHGVAGKAVNRASRLLEAPPLKRALASSSGVLAVIASQWFFEEVILEAPASAVGSYRRVQVSVKETQTTGWICLPDDPYPSGQVTALPAAQVATVPRQLPAATAGFVGRAAALQALTDRLQEAVGAERVVISAVSGMAGIGKTALAVYGAHRVAERFGDGQLYVDLRGFDPSGQPMTAGEAVRGFLDAFEVPREQIPDGLDAQAALYRSLLAGRRVLVVLDNARDAKQVRPLLPGSPGCAVIITSRNQLTSLIAAEGARPLTLDLLTDQEARQLLAGRIGEARVMDEPGAVADIITSCGGLPLALSIVAARAAVHPEFPLEALAGKLRDTRGALDVCDGGDQATDVRTVFSWSYHQLSAQAARLFRLLGLHPGPDIAPPAAASLAALPEGGARSALAELAQAHLIIEHVPDRFAFHDLLRTYATEQAHHHDTRADRLAAEFRMLDHYLHAAHTAATSLYPRWEPVRLARRQPGVTPQRCAGYAAAWAWFEAERPALLAVIQLAADTGRAASAWKLSWALMDYLDRRGHWDDLTAIHKAALKAARKRNNRRGQAHAHEGLGISYRWLGRYKEAETHLQEALKLFAELGDQVGLADSHSGFIWWFQYQCLHEKALERAELALTLYRAAGHRAGEAHALSDIAWSHTLLHDDHQALTDCEQALTLFRERGDRHGEAHTLDTLGYAHNHLGDHEAAIRCYQQSLDLHTELCDRYHQAVALDHLGDIHHAAGDLSAACAAWQQAQDNLGHIPALGPTRDDRTPDGYPDAQHIGIKLHQLGSPIQVRNPQPRRSATWVGGSR